MATQLFPVRELVEPIVGGYWGQEADGGSGNVRIVRNGDVLENGEIGPKTPVRILSEKEVSKAMLRENDIVITISGNVGRVAFVKTEVDENGRFFAASNFVKILRSDTSRILPKYLFYLLRSSIFISEMKKHTRGVAIQNLSVKIFDQRIVPVPSLPEQERIVAFLEEADGLKRKRNETDQKMSKLIPTIYSRMFGNTSWPKTKISDLVLGKRSIRTGPFGSHLHHDEFTDMGVPVLAIDNVVSNTFRWAKPRHLPIEKYAKFKQFRVFPGDVLVTIMGTVGRVCIAPHDLPECKSTKHLCVITPDTSKINPIFLWASLLYDPQVKHQTRNAGKGAVMEGWNSTIIKNLLVSVPPIELQNEFAESVASIQSLQTRQVASAEKIDQISATLLHQIFETKL